MEHEASIAVGARGVRLVDAGRNYFILVRALCGRSELHEANAHARQWASTLVGDASAYERWIRGERQYTEVSHGTRRGERDRRAHQFSARAPRSKIAVPHEGRLLVA